jgi:hypothetical protein
MDEKKKKKERKYTKEERKEMAARFDYSFLLPDTVFGNYKILGPHKPTKTRVMVWAHRVRGQGKSDKRVLCVWYDGKLVSVIALSKRLGFSNSTLVSRIKKWNPETDGSLESRVKDPLFTRKGKGKGKGKSKSKGKGKVKKTQKRALVGEGFFPRHKELFNKHTLGEKEIKESIRHWVAVRTEEEVGSIRLNIQVAEDRSTEISAEVMTVKDSSCSTV